MEDIARAAIEAAEGKTFDESDPAEAWINVTPPGGYHKSHTHATATWSGVLYANVPSVPQRGNDVHGTSLVMRLAIIVLPVMCRAQVLHAVVNGRLTIQQESRAQASKVPLEGERRARLMNGTSEYMSVTPSVGTLHNNELRENTKLLQLYSSS